MMNFLKDVMSWLPANMEKFKIKNNAEKSEKTTLIMNRIMDLKRSEITARFQQ